MERAEGDHAFRDPRDHLCAVQPDDVEAAMSGHPSFSVAGKRVTVVGAARRGVAPPELPVRPGAPVTLTDTRAEIEDQDRLRKAGVELELGWHREETLTRAD